jgi:hypothetical protein
MNIIDTLAAELEAAKIAESHAMATRVCAENALLQLCDAKDEGSTTTRGDQYRVVTLGVVNRRFDPAALEAIRASIPADLFEQVVRYKPEPILAGLRYMQMNEPETYAVLAQALTATPGKTGVRVEFVGEMREAA